MKKASILQLFTTLIITALCAAPIAAQTTAFNYQGKLTDAGNPTNGAYDMQFKLFDTDTVGTGTQQGTAITNPTVQVTAGSFSVQLDFGTNVFTGAARFLEIGVRPAGSPNPHTILSPRQPITASPYAIQTVNAQQLGGLAATRYVATDTNGNVGIGTTTPSTKLEVVDPVRQLRFGPTTADNGGYLISTVPHQAIIIGGARWDSTGNWIARDTTASMTAHQFGAIEFYTNSGLTEGDPFSPALRMRINASGNVSIGTNDTLAKLHVEGGGSDSGIHSHSINGYGVRGDSSNDAGVYGASFNNIGTLGFSSNNIGVYGATGNPNSYAGFFEGAVNATRYDIHSDARLKQNISKLNYGLAEVLRLRPVSWRWKAHPESGEQLGLVAQEVEPVLPELVTTDKNADKMKGLNYIGLIPVLVNAIQEQQQQLAQYRAQLAQQQARDRQQQQEMAAIKKLLCRSHPHAALCKAK